MKKILGYTEKQWDKLPLWKRGDIISKKLNIIRKELRKAKKLKEVI
jgi:hypothetical protein